MKKNNEEEEDDDDLNIANLFVSEEYVSKIFSFGDFKQSLLCSNMSSVKTFYFYFYLYFYYSMINIVFIIISNF
jgi:hypothetical protein